MLSSPPRLQVWLRTLGLAVLCGLGSLLQAQVITPQANPNFGKVLENATTGTVVLSPLGTPTATGGTTLFGGAVSAMAFTVSGTNGNLFTIQNFPGSLSLSGPGGNVSVDTWVTDLGGGGMSGVFGPAPTTVHAGATLRLPGSPIAGNYTGTVTLLLHNDTANTTSVGAVFTVSVNVGNALTAILINDLDFGSFVVQGAGTVQVRPNNTRSTSANLTAIPQAGFQPGTVLLSGTPGAGFSVTLPVGAVTLTGPGSISMDTFQSSTTPSLALNGAGNSILRVGATVHVSAGQPQGLYTGSFNVTITYN